MAAATPEWHDLLRRVGSPFEWPDSNAGCFGLRRHGRGSMPAEVPMSLLLALLLQAIAPSAAAPPPTPSASKAADGAPPPTIDQLVELRRVGSVALSPDGKLVAYTVREANWDENAFETEIWLAEVDSGESRRLTNGKKSSDAPAFSPDGKSLAFASDRGEKRQVYLIDPRGGEPEVLTSAEEGVQSFAWSPDGSAIAFTAQEPKSEALKEREKRHGEYELVDQDHRMTHLHVVELASRKPRRLTEGAFSVGRFDWSPDGSEIAFDHRRSPDPGDGGSADISIVTVADATLRPLVTQAGPDSNPVFSPDGTHVAFESAMGREPFYYTNGVVAAVARGGGPPASLTAAFDETPSLVDWGPSGIWLFAAQRTEAGLFRLDPDGRAVARVALEGAPIAFGFSFDRGFERVAFTGSSASSYPEVCIAAASGGEVRRLSRLGQQLDGWTLGTSEVVSWKSQDGTPIEGVLRKPKGWTPGAKRPLLVIVHGGPTGTSRPSLVGGGYVYPVEAFLSKGALILDPNYRGSAGYGEAFRARNVRNLGIGDAWDVLSGIDQLVKQGLVDPDRVGVMGWSQGGYISAFLATHDSARFRAVSVGAGISNWVTYYVNTDIHPFTRQYLKAVPWDDMEIYRRTSPMTYIKRAKAPVLIQHGDGDKRVPLPNAYELYQGLADQGVETKLVVFKGFGHGLNKPRAVRAALEQNLEWFSRHVLDAR
jgi:dipeptidyl aminopeptidase/acylaminoacyl peptidase